MIKIEAVIRTSKIHDVQDALAELDIPTISTYKVQLSGLHQGHKGWRNKTSDYLPKSKIEILCSDEKQESLVNAILSSAKTGEKGDGIVFAYSINNLVKIKNGESGDSALK